ncbi:TspO/MBR family protein [Emcibacter sp. SYSU 3D8]|uniref:TspO/MBR family protein n=1 Tax=Emcibacter sp. SYSU 3D8 TaxID=3133969 RepID=UPI0031FE9D89
MNRFVSLGIFLVFVVGGGAAIGMLTAPGGWYAELAKPAFNPPNWLFGPVWTALYVLIAIAGWRCWRSDRRGLPMRLWWLQMALNFIWSPIFFTAHAIGAALAVILLLLGAILGFIRASWDSDRTASCLFLPYAAWVAFAALLNAALFILN